MKRLITITILAVLLVAAPATAAEEGATFFDNHTCVEADGTPGLGMADGQCMTIADYDAMFSFESLSEVASITHPSRTVAETGDITVDSGPASVRPLGIGFTDEPFTFIGSLTKNLIF